MPFLIPPEGYALPNIFLGVCVVSFINKVGDIMDIKKIEDRVMNRIRFSQTPAGMVAIVIGFSIGLLVGKVILSLV